MFYLSVFFIAYATFLHHRLNKIKNDLVIGWHTFVLSNYVDSGQLFNLIHVWRQSNIIKMNVFWCSLTRSSCHFWVRITIL